MKNSYLSLAKKIFLILSIIPFSINLVFGNSNSYENNITDNTGYSAIIKEFLINDKKPNDSYVPIKFYETIRLSVTIENTTPQGSDPKSFWLGYSFSEKNSNLNWPDGFYDLPPIETPLLEPGQITYIDVDLTIPGYLEVGKYDWWISIWDDYNENIPLEDGAMSPNPDTGNPYDRKSLIPAFEVIDDNLEENPFNIEQYDMLGIYNQIPKSRRNNGLKDLEDFHTGERDLMVVDRRYGTAISEPMTTENKKIIIAIHGWMDPIYSSNPDPYSGSKWFNIVKNARENIKNDWSIVEYNWYNDAYVNFFWDRDAFWKSETTLKTDEETKSAIIQLTSLPITALAYRYTSLAKISAFKSYQHGLMIARKLEKLGGHLGASYLEKVQIVCHSAGSWAGIALTQFLGNRYPGIELQLIYLDPFIPSRLSLSPSSLLNGDVLSSISLLTTQNTNAPGSQAYWTSGGITNIPVLVGPATEINWEWSSNQGDILKVDEIINYTLYSWSDNDRHDIPVYYYGESIKNPESMQFAGGGWIKSLAYKDKEVDPNQIVFKSIISNKSSYSPGETATLSVTLDNELTDADVSYSINGGQYKTVNVIGSGEYQVSFNAPATPGNYTITVKAEKDSYAPATGKTNFSVTEPNTGHDYAVTQLLLDKTNYDFNDNIEVIAQVENIGTVAQNNVPVIIMLKDPNNNTVDEFEDLLSLNPGEKKSYIEDLYAPSGSPDGNYTVEVRCELSTDFDPSNDIRQKTIYIGAMPAFSQLYYNETAIIEGIGSSGTYEGYSIKLLKFWDSYNGRKAVEIEVSKSSYNQSSVCFVDELSFFDNGKYVLIPRHIEPGESKEAWFDVYTTSNDIEITPQRLILDAGFSDIFKFSTNYEQEMNVRAAYGEDADIVDDWIEVQNFDRGDFDLVVDVPLEADRTKHKFWIKIGSYLHYLEIDVNEPHNIKAVDLQPQNNSSFTVGDIIDIKGTFKNNGGYNEFGRMIRLTIDGPDDFQYTTFQTIDISKGQQKETFFSWNTAGSLPGQYSITIEAIVDEDPYDDNSLSRNITLENPPANITASPTVVNFNKVNIEDCSIKSYNLEGYFLESDIEISAPVGFQVSTNENSGYTENLIVSPEDNSVNQVIFVRFCPSETKSYSGNIEHSSAGANPVNVSVNGLGTEDPGIDVSITSIASFENIDVGTCSSNNSYSLSGSNLTGNLMITAPDGFKISTNNSSGFSSSLVLSPTNGNLSTTTIYVRFCPSEEKNYSGNITHSTTGTETKNVSVSGNGFEEPCIPPPPPGGVNASDGTYCDKVRITWNNVNEASSYNVYREETKIASNITNTVYDDFDVSVSPKMYYVTAVNECESEKSSGNSGYKNECEESHDFYASNLRLMPSSVSPGEQFTFYYRLAYSGTSDSLLYTTYKVFYGYTSSFDDVVAEITRGYSYLSKNVTYDEDTLNIRLNENATQSQYYFFVVADYDNHFNETDENNNISYVVLQVNYFDEKILFADKTEITLNSESGSSSEISITSNIDWNVKTSAEWLDINPSAGNGNGIFTITTLDANSGSMPRNGTVTISGEGVEDVVVTVSQDGNELLSIAEVQGWQAVSPFTNETVTVHGKVTAVTDDGFWLQDESNLWSGIFVKNETKSSVEAGSLWQISGTVKEQNGVTVIMDAEMIELSGKNFAIEPVNIEVTNPIDESHESVLIRYHGVKAAELTDDYIYFGEWSAIGGMENKIIIDDLIYKFQPVVGNYYEITGIGHYYSGKFKIAPRNESDLIDLTATTTPLLTDGGINIYPNPFNDIIRIENSEKIQRIVINNISGQKLMDLNNPSSEINTDKLLPGLYLITLHLNGNRTLTKKLVKLSDN